MKSAEVVRRLESEGWQKAHQAGSHIKFRHPDKPGAVTVPHPKKDLPIGTKCWDCNKLQEKMPEKEDRKYWSHTRSIRRVAYTFWQSITSKDGVEGANPADYVAIPASSVPETGLDLLASAAALVQAQESQRFQDSQHIVPDASAAADGAPIPREQ